MNEVLTVDMSDFGSHGCPRQAVFEIDHAAHAVWFIECDEGVACPTCDREFATLYLPCVVENIHSQFPNYELKGWD